MFRLYDLVLITGKQVAGHVISIDPLTLQVEVRYFDSDGTICTDKFSQEQLEKVGN